MNNHARLKLLLTLLKYLIMSLQQEFEALYSTTLQQRFAAHINQISDDIIGESTSVPSHYLRVILVEKARVNSSFSDKLAKLFLRRAIAQSALTLPLAETGSPAQQTTPSDAEVANAINGFFSDGAFLKDCLVSILDNTVY
jgi:hypothetical protein